MVPRLDIMMFETSPELVELFSVLIAFPRVLVPEDSLILILGRLILGNGSIKSPSASRSESPATRPAFFDGVVKEGALAQPPQASEAPALQVMRRMLFFILTTLLVNLLGLAGVWATPRPEIGSNSNRVSLNPLREAPRERQVPPWSPCRSCTDEEVSPPISH